MNVKVPYQILVELSAAAVDAHELAKDARAKEATLALVEHCRAICFAGYEQIVMSRLEEVGYSEDAAKQTVKGDAGYVYQGFERGESAVELAEIMAMDDEL